MSDETPSDCAPRSNPLPVTRRRLLRTGAATATASTAGFAGCLDGSRSPEEFDSCWATGINIDALPSPAKTEVETALEDGQYETEDELYLSHVMDIDGSYLLQGSWFWRDVERSYRPVVDPDGETTTLELEQAVPSHGERHIEIRNHTEETRTGEIRITRLRTDEIVVEEPLMIEPDATTETAAFDREFGSYQAVYTPEEGDEQADEWNENNELGALRELSIGTDLDLSNNQPIYHPEECASWAE